MDFDSIDHQPVHSIFLVISPTIPMHLRILAQLGFVLRDPALRQMLRERASDESVLTRLKVLDRPMRDTTPTHRSIRSAS